MSHANKNVLPFAGSNFKTKLQADICNMNIFITKKETKKQRIFSESKRMECHHQYDMNIDIEIFSLFITPPFNFPLQIAVNSGDISYGL